MWGYARSIDTCTLHVLPLLRAITPMIVVSQTVPKQKESTQTDQRRLLNATRLGAARIPFLHQKRKKITPSILYCFDKAKPIQIEFQRNYVTKMVTDMTFKVHNSICIAVVHTYITYHIIEGYIYMYVGWYSYRNMSIRIRKCLCFLMYIPMHTYAYKKIMGD